MITFTLSFLFLAEILGLVSLCWWISVDLLQTLPLIWSLSLSTTSTFTYNTNLHCQKHLVKGILYGLLSLCMYVFNFMIFGTYFCVLGRYKMWLVFCVKIQTLSRRSTSFWQNHDNGDGDDKDYDDDDDDCEDENDDDDDDFEDWPILSGKRKQHMEPPGDRLLAPFCHLCHIHFLHHHHHRKELARTCSRT